MSRGRGSRPRAISPIVSVLGLIAIVLVTFVIVSGRASDILGRIHPPHGLEITGGRIFRDPSNQSCIAGLLTVHSIGVKGSVHSLTVYVASPEDAARDSFYAATCINCNSLGRILPGQTFQLAVGFCGDWVPETGKVVVKLVYNIGGRQGVTSSSLDIEEVS